MGQVKWEHLNWRLMGMDKVRKAKCKIIDCEIEIEKCQAVIESTNDADTSIEMYFQVGMAYVEIEYNQSIIQLFEARESIYA